MTKRNYLPNLHDPELTALHARGLTDHAISDAMGFSKSFINRRRLILGLPTNHPWIRKEHRDKGELPKPDLNPVAASVLLLGVEERPSGYWLNGRPVSSAEIVREANRIRKLKELPQIGPNHWRVP